MFEESRIRPVDTTAWAFDFLIQIAKAIHDWEELYEIYPDSVTISEDSYRKLNAASGLHFWFKDGQLTDLFHGVKIIILPYPGKYLSLRGRR